MRPGFGLGMLLLTAGSCRLLIQIWGVYEPSVGV